MPRNRRRSKNAVKKWWSESQKLEALTMWWATRSPTSVCAAMGINMHTFQSWTKQQWWKDALLQIQGEENGQMSAKMSKIVNKTLEVISDRVENGNFVFDQKTGAIRRIPIPAREATKVATELLAQKKDLDEPLKKVEQEDQKATLLKLAEEFTKFAKAKEIVGVPFKKEIAIDAA
jgi:hypothetical protein